MPLWFYKSGTAAGGPGTNPYNGWCCLQYPMLLDPYVKSAQIWRCPSRSGPYTTSRQVMGCTPHYGYACKFCRATRPTPPQFCDPTYASLGAIQTPASTPVFGESAAGRGTGDTQCGLSRTGPGICGCSWGGCALWYNAYPHNDGRNIVFADGHAKWYNKQGDTKAVLDW